MPHTIPAMEKFAALSRNCQEPVVWKLWASCAFKFSISKLTASQICAPSAYNIIQHTRLVLVNLRNYAEIWLSFQLYWLTKSVGQNLTCCKNSCIALINLETPHTRI